MRQDIDARVFNELDLLIERGDHARSPIRRQKTNRMGRKRHGNRLHAQFARPLHNRLQNLAMSEMQAVEIADADDGRPCEMSASASEVTTFIRL